MNDEEVLCQAASLQKSIRTTVDLLDNWVSELNLDVFVFDQFRHKYNVLEATDSNKRLLFPYIYFDPLKYPFHDGFDGEGWKKLLHHLEREAYTQGFGLLATGYGRGGKNVYRRLVCKHGVLYQNSIDERKSVTNYRKTAKKNDRVYGRGSIGKTM